MSATRTSSGKLSRQALYQRRRRAKHRPVTFFPIDRARMDRAIDESGLGVQGWLARAVEDRIARQAQIAALVAEAFRQFKARCFWNVSPDRPLALLVPLALKRLKKYGGAEGLKLAAKIEALAGADGRWP